VNLTACRLPVTSASADLALLIRDVAFAVSSRMPPLRMDPGAARAVAGGYPKSLADKIA